MPEKTSEEKTKRIKFSMETRSFATIWRNHITHPDRDDWRAFVLACWKRYTGTGNEGNRAALNEYEPKWAKWSEDEQYTFLSERVYAKCITLQRTLRKEMGLSIDLPDGYKDRAGKKVSKRVSVKELADIFTFEDDKDIHDRGKINIG